MMRKIWIKNKMKMIMKKKMKMKIMKTDNHKITKWITLFKMKIKKKKEKI